MLITVFTPTYNRSPFLEKAYHSLCGQTLHDFEWLIVDDGSTDETETTIQKIVQMHQEQYANPFPIHYYKKANGGKHTAINVGVKMAKGELFLILDSDDTLPKDSLEIIGKSFLQINHTDSIGGVCGLMSHHDGRQIGSGFAHQECVLDEIQLRFKMGVTGDLLEVFRTSVMREFPFPEIPGERFCPEQLIWFRIAKIYQLKCIDKTIYYRDYLEGGLSDKIVRIRMQSPIASCMTYQEMLDYPIPFSAKVKAAINYWRFRFCIRPHSTSYPRIKGLWNILMPLGWMMHMKDWRSQ